MSITIKTQAQVESIAISYFQVAHRNPITGKSPPVGPRTFLGGEARALAQLIGETLYAVKSSDDDAVPGTYTDANGVTRTRNSTKSLDDWAFVLGLLSNSPGRYGRKQAQPAKGGGATVFGTPGVVVAAGAQLTDLSGKIVVQLRSGFTIPGGGFLDGVIIDAITEGLASNLPVGTTLRWSSPPPGLQATVTLSAALTIGLDVETDVALAQRIVQHLQDAPKGGTAADFRVWTEAAEDGDGALVGVVRAYIYKRRNGTGSVTIVPTMGGLNSFRAPDATALAQIQTWVDNLHIASDVAYVVAPRFVTGEELSVSITINAQPAYDFDWSAAIGPTLVVSGTGGATTLVTDQNPQRASLRTAVDNGNKPRIAISIAGVPLPFISRVTAYSGANLTLETPLPATLAGGEEVLPAGSATLPVASAILDYVNNVGPSRAGGYADRLDPWEDSVSIGRIAQVALSARDADSGDIVCVWSPGVGNGAGVTIAVGAGSPAGDDYQLRDNIYAQGPQLPEIKAIAVRRAS